MAEDKSASLTDEERAELEELRAEKAAREEEARARWERAELERLRAEKAAADAASTADAEGSVKPKASKASTPKKASKPASAAAQNNKQKEKTFAQRMVTSELDEDDIPGMPPAQKVIIAVCLIAVVVMCLYLFVL